MRQFGCFYFELPLALNGIFFSSDSTLNRKVTNFSSKVAHDFFLLMSLCEHF